MADYKAMYYHLAGRMTSAIEALEAATTALEANAKAFKQISDKMQTAMQTTEEMFIDGEDAIVTKFKGE